MKTGKWMLLCVPLMLSLSVRAAVYRCPGAQGVQFQDWPCGGAPVLRGGAADAAGTGLRASERAWLRQRERARARHHRTVQKERPQAADARARRCWSRRRRLARVRDALRRGYRPARGERLRRQRRELEDYLSRFCD